MHFDDDELSVIVEALGHFIGACRHVGTHVGDGTIGRCCQYMAEQKVAPILRRIRQDAEDRLAEKNDG